MPRTAKSTAPEHAARYFRSLDYAVAVSVAVLTFAAFFPILSNGFVNFDDPVNLLQNFRYRGLGLKQLGWMFTTLHNSLYRPLTWIVWSVDYELFGLEPFGYHATSLVFHAVNAALVYFLVRRLLLLAFQPEARSPLPVRLAAAFAAVLFGVHPLRVEAVAWASALNDVVSGLFFLAALLCYVHAPISDLAIRRRRIALSLAFYALSLLAKPSGATLPFVLLILDVYPLRRLSSSRWRGPEARGIWLEKLPFLVLAAGAVAVALVGKQNRGLLVGFADYGVPQRMVQSIYSLIFYLGKMLWPSGLSVLYELRRMALADSRLLASAVLIAAVSIVLWSLRRRWPAGLAAWGVYILILAPVMGMFQNGPQFAADRYSYLASLPWVMLAAGGCVYVRRVWSASWIALLGSWAIATAVVVALIGATWRQSEVWRDSESLWRQAVRVDMNSYLAHYFLGDALRSSGKTDDAVEEFRRTSELNPGYASAYAALGAVMLSRGDVDAAIKFFNETLRLDPSIFEAHYNLALILARRGDVDEAVAHYREAVRIDPDDPDAHNNLGRLLAHRGDTGGATAEFLRAVEIDDRYTNAYYNLGRVMLQSGDAGAAIPYFETALRLEPGVAEIHEQLARALAQQGRKEEAMRHYETAVMLMRGRQR